MWESRPVLAMIRFEHHQRPESRPFVGMATGLICIDTKGLLSIHRLIQNVLLSSPLEKPSSGGLCDASRVPVNFVF